MKSFVEDYLERLENLVTDLCEAVQGLPQEAMDWKPGPDMKAIGVLLAHTAGSLRYWIGDIALGEPSGRVRASEFQAHGIPGQVLQQRLREILAYARAGLPRFQSADLALPGASTAEGEVVTRNWALLHALEHASLHLGHIQLTAQLWKQRTGS